MAFMDSVNLLPGRLTLTNGQNTLEREEREENAGIHNCFLAAVDTEGGCVSELKASDPIR